MATLKGFWQFLNTDVKEIPWGELAERGIEAVGTAGELGEKWEEHQADLDQLGPHIKQMEPFLTVLNDPDAQLVLSGLPFVSIGIGLLRLYLNQSKNTPTLENSVELVAQLAYLQSLETVLAQVIDAGIAEKLGKISLRKLLEKQVARLETDKLSSYELKIVTSRFRESKLAEQFGEALTEQLQQAGLGKAAARKLMEQVGWGTPRFLSQAIVEAGDNVEPLAEYYRTGGQQEQDRYVSIDAYLKERIAPLPKEQVFDESEPLITFEDIYVPLKVQPLEQSGDEKDADPISIHEWAQRILDQTEPRKVMFIQGDAGQGKSVFCRMLAAEVRKASAFSYIPLLIRLRSLRAIENTLTETLENCPDLEPVEFVGQEGWLKDKNTRFLIILDGFDELLLQGRASGGLQEILQQVSDFQERSHHQCLVTGRPLALQGVAQRITQNKNLDRVKLLPMDDEIQEQWLANWRTIFGETEVTEFQKFLKACPDEITNNLAREPLLLYLLARLHREGQLTGEMFADAKQESQAKLRVYRESVNWVLEKQRQAENERLSGLDDPDDLREVLQEAALCVVQSGNETAQLSMLKARFQDSGNPVATLLKTAQETTGQTEDKALNNLLTTFYLRPGEGDKRGSVEFAHKSFGEYLFAERLMVAFEDWTELDRRNRFQLDERAVHGQIYDLLGFGGLSDEIVEYTFELLDESEIDRVKLFQRLHLFYERWCEGEFLDQAPTENLSQKKFLQLRDQKISGGLRHVDVFTGLNVLIVLFKLHAAAQPEGYPNFPENTPKPDISFHPCGEPDTDQFNNEKLLKIIHYADALGIRTFTKVVGPHLSSANLSSANLSSANLSSANLSSANLSGADLSGADLYNANLYNANLYNANLSSADLSSANLSSANLSSADLDSADLYSAYLNSADLDSAYLYRSDLSNVDLYSADLSSADLSSANLSSANLSSADLYSANLDSANLSDANLSDANLDNADLSSADLYSADLSSANLDRAILSSANLSGANLSDANLDSAILDRANFDRANFDRAILLGSQLSTAQNLTSQQLEGESPPLICATTLPQELKAYQDRDRGRLPAILKERYPRRFKSLEEAEKFIN